MLNVHVQGMGGVVLMLVAVLLSVLINPMFIIMYLASILLVQVPFWTPSIDA